MTITQDTRQAHLLAPNPGKQQHVLSRLLKKEKAFLPFKDQHLQEQLRNGDIEKDFSTIILCC